MQTQLPSLAEVKTYGDGGHYRIEIPSIEGPKVFESLLVTAQDLGVTINRISQGSGGMLLLNSEIREMAKLGADNHVEVCLFVGPRAGYDVGLLAHTQSKFANYASLRGSDQINSAIADIERAVEYGIRGFLIGDLGLLSVLRDRQERGKLPMNIHWKVSAYVAAGNAPTVKILEDLGASSINIPSDLTYLQINELREAVNIPLDIYVEAMDSSGGTIRLIEMSSLIRAGAPICVKFGLANARTLYPAGDHITDEAIKIARAKAKRAAIAKEWLDRLDPDLKQSFNRDSTAIPEV
jgi:hypothetical protein